MQARITQYHDDTFINFRDVNSTMTFCLRVSGTHFYRSLIQTSYGEQRIKALPQNWTVA